MALILKDLLQSFINEKKDWKVNLLYKWHDIIGPLSDKVRIEKIYDDILILGVFNSCWLQELYLLSPLLLKTINEKLDQPYIKQLRFKHVSIKKTVSKKSSKTTSIKNNTSQLTHHEERSLSKITDPSLREALRAFRLRCYQEK